jgi:hypothetical protein
LRGRGGPVQPLADELADDLLDKLADGAAQLVFDERLERLVRRGHGSGVYDLLTTNPFPRAHLRRRHVAAASCEPPVLIADFGAFVSTVAASVIAGLIVLAVAYYVVEEEFALRERAERAKETEKQRRQTREAVLYNVHAELESNAALLSSSLTLLPSTPDYLLYPGFDISAWPMVSSTGVFTSLNPETATALVHAYNRMGTTNEQNAALLELTQGPTAILAAIGAAQSLDKAPVAKAYARLQELRSRRREELLDRLKDLEGYLYEAIDAVEVELELDRATKAADRQYVTEQPQGP